jgi:hypothetical protein
LDHGFLFAWLIPDANELSLNITSLSSGNGIQDGALRMRPASVDEVWPKTVLSLLRRPSIMTIGHEQIDLDRSSCSQVLRASQAHPSLLSSAQARRANTALFPAKSTRYPLSK